MNCPVCKVEMAQEDFGRAKIDVCKNGCKGLWFDWKELAKLDESHEGFGNALKESLNSPRAKDENRGQINCPKCNMPMMAHLHKRAKAVTVDECYGCAGFFLDAGELKVIRDNSMTDEECKAYAKEILKTDPVYHKFEKDFGKQQGRAQAVGKFAALLNTNVMGKQFSW